MSDAERETFVFRQRLSTAIATLLGGACALGFTVWALIESKGAGFGFGVIAVATGWRWILASIRTLRAPGRLIIAPDGLTYACAGWSRRWSWAGVGPFKVMHGSSGPSHVAFTVHGLAAVVDDLRRPGLPDVWNASLYVVCRELNAARTRWGPDAYKVAPEAVTPYVG